MCACALLFFTRMWSSCRVLENVNSFDSPRRTASELTSDQARPDRALRLSDVSALCSGQRGTSLLGGRPMRGTGIGMLCTQYQGGLLCALLAAARRAAQRFRILC